MSLENSLNLPHVVTFSAMRQVAAFAEGELSFIALQGSKSGNPGLPLTHAQKKLEQQKKEQHEEKQKRAAAAKAEREIAGRNTQSRAADTPADNTAAAATDKGKGSKGGKGDKNTQRLSTPTSTWAALCRDWKQGYCSRGISCLFQHDGIPVDAGRCFMCGGKGHSTKECTVPGGAKDPKHDENWAAYRERRDKAKEAGKGQGKDPKGKGKGKGKGKDATAKSAAATGAHSDTFPPGAVGLDSWANVYLRHQDPSEATKKWKDSLRLAWGQCACETCQGPKGIPLCKVEKRPGEDNIDLLPLGWLWTRGCDYGMTGSGW